MDEITKRWFDASMVRVCRSPELKDFHTDEVLARLSGAPKGSLLEAGHSVDGIELKVTNQDLLCEPLVRFIRPTPEGHVFEIRNAGFVLRPQFRGLGIGPRSVAFELHEAQRLDYLSKVVTHAVGDWTSRTGEFAMNGYVVWARMGFNAKLPESILGHPALPPSCQGMRDVVSLMSCTDGQDFWVRYGSSLWMEFPLQETSASWIQFRNYARERNIEVTTT
jgi:GNAT superfamily N-acetyltransferase